jgi:predicted RNase H-related nuclease YkuK (DUF458 family)
MHRTVGCDSDQRRDATAQSLAATAAAVSPRTGAIFCREQARRANASFLLQNITFVTMNVADLHRFISDFLFEKRYI